MSFDLGDSLLSDGIQNDMKKTSTLPGKIFSIENLLKNGSKSDIEKEMSTRGSSDGEEGEDDDISEQEDLEICSSNGDQIYPRKNIDIIHIHQLKSYLRFN